jgi:hypothetical protein
VRDGGAHSPGRVRSSHLPHMVLELQESKQRAKVLYIERLLEFDRSASLATILHGEKF